CSCARGSARRTPGSTSWCTASCSSSWSSTPGRAWSSRRAAGSPAGGRRRRPDVASLLDVRGVSKRFGGLSAVRDVSFSVEEGEIVGVIGPNGAGKTTLFSLVSGFIRPDAGEIRFQDRTVTDLAPERRCHLGLCRTFQLVKPFGSMTVRQNVMVGAFARHRRPGDARAAADGVLEATGM